MKKMSIVLLFLFAAAASAPAQTIVGESIHSFRLTDLNGKSHSPGDYQGKILGIYLLGHG